MLGNPTQQVLRTAPFENHDLLLFAHCTAASELLLKKRYRNIFFWQKTPEARSLCISHVQRAKMHV
jgi:hypothetical protein